MFRQLFSALRGSETLDDAFAEFSQMLEHASWMFVQANAVLRRDVEASDSRDAIFERDKSINALVRSIRRKIVRHLTINPGMDVAACLALMSVAKDAERIGDYCKNVFEVGQFYRQDFHIARYHEPLEEMRQEVESLFSSVQEAFLNSDSSRAKEALEAELPVLYAAPFLLSPWQAGVLTHLSRAQGRFLQLAGPFRYRRVFSFLQRLLAGEEPFGHARYMGGGRVAPAGACARTG